MIRVDVVFNRYPPRDYDDAIAVQAAWHIDHVDDRERESFRPWRSLAELALRWRAWRADREVVEGELLTRRS